MTRRILSDADVADIRASTKPPWTLADRYGVTAKEIRTHDEDAGTYRIEDETFEVFVPPGYASDKPHALFVWILGEPLFECNKNRTVKRIVDHQLQECRE